MGRIISCASCLISSTTKIKNPDDLAASPQTAPSLSKYLQFLVTPACSELVEWIELSVKHQMPAATLSITSISRALGGFLFMDMSFISGKAASASALKMSELKNNTFF